MNELKPVNVYFPRETCLLLIKLFIHSGCVMDSRMCSGKDGARLSFFESSGSDSVEDGDAVPRF